MFFKRNPLIAKLTLVSLLTALLAACDDREVTGSRWPAIPDEKAFETSVPVKTNFSRELRFHSVVSGFNSVTKSFFEAGRIESIKVVEGQMVQPGDVLATLYSPTLSEELAEAEASLEKAKAELKLNLEDLARSVRLFKKKVISQQELDETKRTFDVNTQVVKEAEAIVARYINEIEDLNIVAKEPGVVSELFNREGDFLSAGEPLMRFESTGRQKVVFDVPEKISLTVNIGSEAELYLPALDRLVNAVAIEKSLPTKGDLALHKLTFEIQEPLSSLVGLRSVLILETLQSLAYKVDYRTIRYARDGTAYLIKANDTFSKVPVDVVDLKSDSVIVKANFEEDSQFLLGGDVTLPVNLYQ